MQVVSSRCVPTGPHDRVQLDGRLPRRDERWRGDETVRLAPVGDTSSRVSVEEALGRALDDVARLKARLAGERDRHRDVLNATAVDDIVGRTPLVLRHYADDAGVSALAELRTRGAVLHGSRPYLRLLLQEATGGR